MSDYTEHARLSPSGSKKWMSCPGSLTMEAPIAVKISEAADKGTCCHIIAARTLTEQWPPETWLGEDVKVSNATEEEERFIEFDDELCELVREYVRNVRQYTTQPGVLHWVEERVHTSRFLGVPNQFGTADLLVYVPTDFELQVHDAKFGHRRVGVEGNSQLLIYALGAYDMLELGYEIKTIRIVIHQPQINNGPIEWTVPLETLLGFAEKARDSAQLVELAAAEWERITGGDSGPTGEELTVWYAKFLNPTPNEEECAFCRAMAVCPNAQAEVERTVGASFSAIVETKDEARMWVPEPGPRLDEVMRATPFLEDFVTAARARMEGHLLGGGESQFFGLELGRRGHRRWTDVKEAEQMLRGMMRLTIEEAFNLKLKSPTQVEKMAGDAGKVVQARHAKAAGTPQENNRIGGRKTPARKAKDMNLPPPTIGPTQWNKLQALITRNPPKPSVKPLTAITEPYKAPPLSGDSFQAIVDTADDIS